MRGCRYPELQTEGGYAPCGSPRRKTSEYCDYHGVWIASKQDVRLSKLIEVRFREFSAHAMLDNEEPSWEEFSLAVQHAALDIWNGVWGDP